MPLKVLTIIYQSLLHPYFTYGIEAWHGTYKNHTDKIFIIQKKGIRAINDLEYNEHTNEYFKSNQILKLQNQFQLQLLVYIYKLFNSNIDPSISSNFNLNSSIHHHFTKSSNEFNVARINKSRTKFCIGHDGIKLWNNIPDNIKTSKSLYKFKKMLKTFFLDKY